MGIFDEVQRRMERRQRQAGLIGTAAALLLGQTIPKSARAVTQPLLNISGAYLAKQVRRLPPAQAGFAAPGISNEAVILWMDEDDNREILASSMASNSTNPWLNQIVKGDWQQILADQAVTGELAEVINRELSRNSKSGKFDLMDNPLLAKEIQTFFANKMDNWHGPLPPAECESILLKIASTSTTPPTVLTQKWDKMWAAEQKISNSAHRPLRSLMLRLAKDLAAKNITNLDALHNDPQSPFASMDDQKPLFRQWAEEELNWLTVGNMEDDQHPAYPGVLRQYLLTAMNIKATVPKYNGPVLTAQLTTTAPEPIKPTPPVIAAAELLSGNNAPPDNLPAANKTPVMSAALAQQIASKMLALALLQRGYDRQLVPEQINRWGETTTGTNRLQGWDQMVKAYPDITKTLDKQLVTIAKLAGRNSIFCNTTLSVDASTQALLQNYAEQLGLQIRQTGCADDSDQQRLGQPLCFQEMCWPNETAMRPSMLRTQNLLQQQNWLPAMANAATASGTPVTWQESSAPFKGRLLLETAQSTAVTAIPVQFAANQNLNPLQQAI